jgi:RimJ/RimL family protein N-acetyltransferase
LAGRSGIVAADDISGAFAGMWGVIPYLKYPDSALVIGVFVAAAARGTDVATRLHDASLEFARTTAANHLLLHVRDDNAGARRFYERNGWFGDGGDRTRRQGRRPRARGDAAPGLPRGLIRGRPGWYCGCRLPVTPAGTSPARVRSR